MNGRCSEKKSRLAPGRPPVGDLDDCVMRDDESTGYTGSLVVDTSMLWMAACSSFQFLVAFVNLLENNDPVR
jgi:hypothetical protein